MNMSGWKKYHKKGFLILIILIIDLIMNVNKCNSDDNEFLTHPPRVLSSDLSPCSSCHAEMPADLKRRELSFHSEIKIQRHGEAQRWCLDCHDANNRDKLILHNGKKVEFKYSYRLCGQCHENIFRDWKAGIHGKRTGDWDGPKQYYLCTYCHNPHSPRFKPLAPEPVPLRPEKH